MLDLCLPKKKRWIQCGGPEVCFTKMPNQSLLTPLVLSSFYLSPPLHLSPDVLKLPAKCSIDYHKHIKCT